MKIVTVLGSPRPKGNTAKVLGWLEEELVSQGHHVDRVNMFDVTVQGCVECYACRAAQDEPGCPLDDDFLQIYERMASAEGLVYASPLFCWELSSQIKPLIDRHFCLVKNYGSAEHMSLLQGKKAALLITCGGPIEGNADLVLKVFQRMTNYAKLEPAGAEVIAFSTTPEDMPEAVKTKTASIVRQLTGKA